MVGDAHIEQCARAARGFARDTAEADQSQRLPAQVLPEQLGGSPAAPCTGAQQPLALARAARGHQHQQQGDFSGGLGERAWSIGHHDVGAPRGLEVDVLDAGAKVRDDAGAERRDLQQVGVEAIGDRRHQRIEFTQGARQCFAIERQVVGIGRDIVAIGKCVRVADRGTIKRIPNRRWV